MALETNPGDAVLTSNPPPARNGPPMAVSIPPLNVSGLVVTKADLLAALRVYVAQLADIAPMDGERFLLGLAPVVPGENGRM